MIVLTRVTETRDVTRRLLCINIIHTGGRGPTSLQETDPRLQPATIKVIHRSVIVQHGDLSKLSAEQTILRTTLQRKVVGTARSGRFQVSRCQLFTITCHLVKRT